MEYHRRSYKNVQEFKEGLKNQEIFVRCVAAGAVSFKDIRYKDGRVVRKVILHPEQLEQNVQKK